MLVAGKIYRCHDGGAIMTAGDQLECQNAHWQVRKFAAASRLLACHRAILPGVIQHLLCHGHADFLARHQLVPEMDAGRNA